MNLYEAKKKKKEFQIHSGKIKIKMEIQKRSLGNTLLQPNMKV